jgi:hypothetical protein
MSTVNAGHYILGTEGLALLRSWLFAPEGELAGRVEEVARLACAPEVPPMAIRFDAADLDVRARCRRCRCGRRGREDIGPDTPFVGLNLPKGLSAPVSS